MGYVDLGADAVIKVSIPEEILDPYECRPPKKGGYSRLRIIHDARSALEGQFAGEEDRGANYR